MPDPLSAVIVDDEPVARELLRSMLTSLDAEKPVDVLTECGNVREAQAAIEEHDPDVIFLDVEMPGGDGFSLIEAVGIENMPLTIFVTAYDHYALKAFEVVAADYLLKPFDEDRLERTLRRIRSRVQQPSGQSEERIVALLEELRGPERYASRLAVESDHHLIFIPTTDIDWIEAKGKHSLVHTREASYLMREGLTSVAERLSPGDFLRVHRSHIVRIDRIREVHRWFRGDYHLVLADGTKLTSGGTFKKAIEHMLLGDQKPP